MRRQSGHYRRIFDLLTGKVRAQHIASQRFRARDVLLGTSALMRTWRAGTRLHQPGATPKALSLKCRLPSTAASAPRISPANAMSVICVPSPAARGTKSSVHQHGGLGALRTLLHFGDTFSERVYLADISRTQKAPALPNAGA
jgi:hypothetical protein